MGSTFVALVRRTALDAFTVAKPSNFPPAAEDMTIIGTIPTSLPSEINREQL